LAEDADGLSTSSFLEAMSGRRAPPGMNSVMRYGGWAFGSNARWGRCWDARGGRADVGLLEVGEVGWVDGDFDGRELVRPGMMVGAPDLGKGAAPHLFSDIFANPLICLHPVIPKRYVSRVLT